MALHLTAAAVAAFTALSISRSSNLRSTALALSCDRREENIYARIYEFNIV